MPWDFLCILSPADKENFFFYLHNFLFPFALIALVKEIPRAIDENGEGHLVLFVI